MFGLFGVSNTNPFNFTKNLRTWLQDEDIPAGPYRPTLLGFDEWPEDIKGIVLVPTLSLFLQRIEVLKALPVVVFVFDTPVLLEYLPSCELLDVIPKAQAHVYRFKPLDGPQVVRKIQQARAGREHIEVEQKDVELIPHLLGQTQASLLSPILTWLYSVKDTNARQQHMRTIYGWMRGDTDTEHLATLMPGTKSCTALLEWFDSEIGVNTVQAVRTMVQRKAQGKTANLDKIAKDHGINAFDLKYVATTLQKLDASHIGS